MPHSDPAICQELTLMKARLDNLESDMKEVSAGVKNLLHAWEQGIGVAKFLKLLFYVAAPLTAAIYWLKDHVKL